MSAGEDLRCNKCSATGCLVLSVANLDYSCEACGAWQNLSLNSAYYPLGGNA